MQTQTFEALFSHVKRYLGKREPREVLQKIHNNTQDTTRLSICEDDKTSLELPSRSSKQKYQTGVYTSIFECAFTCIYNMYK